LEEKYGKGQPVTCHEGTEAESRYSSTLSLTFTSGLDPFTPGNDRTYCTKAWVGSRADLDACEKSRLLRDSMARTVQRVASRYIDCASDIWERHNKPSFFQEESSKKINSGNACYDLV
jgi:hypothetical protein